MKNPFSLVVSFFSWILDRTLLIFELSVDFTLGTLDIFLSIFRTFYIILKYMIEYRTLRAPRDVWEYSGFIYIANTLILGYIGLVVLLNFFAYFSIYYFPFFCHILVDLSSLFSSGSVFCSSSESLYFLSPGPNLRMP